MKGLTLLLALTSISLTAVVGCDNKQSIPPEVVVKTEEDWLKTTYVISMNKVAAENLRDAVDRVDPKLIGAAFARVAKHPAAQITIALATANADAFKRTLNKDGMIGANGITITLTAHGGKLMSYTSGNTSSPSTTIARGPVCDAMQISVNPWSWNITPRK